MIKGEQASSNRQVNPFTRAEYESFCTQQKTDATHVCAVKTPPASLPKSCKVTDHGVVMSNSCLAELRKMANVTRVSMPSTTAPLFEDAQLCRQRLGGEYKTMYGIDKKTPLAVSFDAMQKIYKDDCTKCCTSILERDVALSKHQDKSAPNKKTPTFVTLVGTV